MTPLAEVLAAAGRAAEKLSPAEYARAFVFDLVTQAVPMLEQARKAHANANEDSLTYTLLAYLNSICPGAVRELDSGGHVDIALKHPVHIRIVLSGEAKVIGPKGFSWYQEGLTKLVGQYNTGRNDLALLVCYCRLPDMYTRLEEFKKQIATELVASYTQDMAPSAVGLADQRGVFVTSHSSAGSVLFVAHVWVNMFVQTDQQLFAAAKRKSASRKRAASR